MTDPEPVSPAFGEEGLLPCLTQDARTGEVLTLAWISPESWRLTRETGEVHFFSRTRQEIWRKGATSGNTQRVVEARIDCDGDAILLLVEPGGPACHTGERTCFYRTDDGQEPSPTTAEALAALDRTLAARRQEMPPDSYSATLFADPDLAAAKVLEEAAEVVEAAQSESDERVAEEAADVVFHLMALLRTRGIGIERVLEVLNGRRG